MKLMKKTNTYKAANCSFNPKTCEALSYNWWIFVKKINGLVVFNNHFYSPTTLRHQSKVQGLLFNLGIKIDLEINTVTSLNNSEAIKTHLVSTYHDLFIAKLHNSDLAKRSVKPTNDLEQSILDCNTKLKVKLSKAEIKTLEFSAENEYIANLNEKCFQRSTKIIQPVATEVFATPILTLVSSPA